MAAAAVDMDEITVSSDNCSVCADRYRDPRILECAHHFCKVCLVEIAERHPQRYVTCPTCRHITRSDDVTNLPRYRIVNDFVNSVNAAAENVDVKVASEDRRFCQICKNTEGKPAMKFCFKCPAQLCDDCAEGKHAGIFEEHKIYQLSPLVFCREHRDIFSTTMCKTCDMTCCAVCKMSNHSDHKWKYVRDEGKFVKLRFEEIKKTIADDLGHKASIKRVNTVLQKAKDIKTEFVTSMARMQESIKALDAKMKTMEEEVTSKLNADIKVLEMMAADLQDFMESKTKLAEHVDKLLTNCTDHDLIVREKETPKYDAKFYKKLICKREVELPDLSTSIIDITKQLDSWTDDCNIKYTRYLLHGTDSRPVTKLENISKFNSGDYVYGIAVDCKRERLIVRRLDAECPITVYDYSGNKQAVLGKGVAGIAGMAHQSTSVDNKRDLLLIPVGRNIVTMDMVGKVLKNRKVGSKRIHCVIHTEEDMYVACQDSDPRILLIEPDTLQVTQQFPSRADYISYPYSIGNNKMDGKDCVFISSCGKSTVVCVEFGMEMPLYTYDSVQVDGQSRGQLNAPYDIFIDPSGSVVICDLGNSRIVSVKRENNSEQWNVLLDKDALATCVSPRYLAFDQEKRVLFVGNAKGDIMSFTAN